MAEVLASFPDDGLRNHPSSRFDQFLDGQIWKVTPQELSVQNGESARTSLRRRAALRNMHVKIMLCTYSEQEYVILQALDGPAKGRK